MSPSVGKIFHSFGHCVSAPVSGEPDNCHQLSRFLIFGSTDICVIIRVNGRLHAPIGDTGSTGEPFLAFAHEAKSYPRQTQALARPGTSSTQQTFRVVPLGPGFCAMNFRPLSEFLLKDSAPET